MVLTWTTNSLGKNRAPKDANYYDNLKEKYDSYTKRNTFITISEAIEAVKTKTIYLLTTDIRTLTLIGVDRGSVEKLQDWAKNPGQKVERVMR